MSDRRQDPVHAANRSAPPRAEDLEGDRQPATTADDERLFAGAPGTDGPGPGASPAGETTGNDGRAAASLTLVWPPPPEELDAIEVVELGPPPDLASPSPDASTPQPSPSADARAAPEPPTPAPVATVDKPPGVVDAAAAITADRLTWPPASDENLEVVEITWPPSPDGALGMPEIGGPAGSAPPDVPSGPSLDAVPPAASAPPAPVRFDSQEPQVSGSVAGGATNLSEESAPTAPLAASPTVVELHPGPAALGLGGLGPATAALEAEAVVSDVPPLQIALAESRASVAKGTVWLDAAKGRPADKAPAPARRGPTSSALRPQRVWLSAAAAALALAAGGFWVMRGVPTPDRGGAGTVAPSAPSASVNAGVGSPSSPPGGTEVAPIEEAPGVASAPPPVPSEPVTSQAMDERPLVTARREETPPPPPTLADTATLAGEPAPAFPLPSPDAAAVARPNLPPPPEPSLAIPASSPAAASEAVGGTATPSGRTPEVEVREALARYRAAYTSLDAQAARRVWPSVDERALARAFAGLKSQQLEFDRCEIAAAAGSATASCEGRAIYVPRVGRQDPQVEPRRWEFTLRPTTEGWRIERAEIRR